MDEVLRAVQDILREITCSPELVIDPRTTADDVEGWDSLAHLRLLDALEDRYRITFALHEVHRLRDVGELLVLIAEKLAQRGRVQEGP